MQENNTLPWNIRLLKERLRWLTIENGLIILGFLMGIAWVFSLSLRSTGTPVQDEIYHLLISQHAWEMPKLMLDMWGRPGYTILYMPVAPLGLQVARFFSLILAAATVWVTFQIGRALNVRHLFLIPLLLWFQPWFSDLSYFSITEVPFSLYLVIGLLFWLRGQNKLAGLFFGLLPLTRHEGIIILGFWCFYLLIRRDYWAIAISLLPYGLYNFIYAIVLHDWPLRIFFKPQGSKIYGTGGWLHFFKPTLEGVGLPVSFLACFVVFALKELKGKALLFVLYASYFVTHTVLYHFGLYSSGGYALFLLPLAPGAALAGALGADRIMDGLRWLIKQNYLQFIVHIILVVVIVGTVVWTGLQVKPRSLLPEEVATLEASNWLKTNIPHPVVVVSTHAWFHMFYNLPWHNEGGINSQPAVNTLKSGSIMVWDKHYSDRLGFKLSVLTAPQSSWKELARFQDGLVIIFQKVQ